MHISAHLMSMSPLRNLWEFIFTVSNIQRKYPQNPLQKMNIFDPIYASVPQFLFENITVVPSV